MDTLLISDARCLAHDAGPGHPERPLRLLAVEESLRAQPVPGMREESARLAETSTLERVHSREHVRRLAATEGLARTWLDPDTSTCPHSWMAALASAGATLRAVEAVVAAQARGAFALVRPPGHHAERDTAMGFCLLNNVAIAAEHAISELGCRRVLVLDPDVHHGNGTQSIFWHRKDVLYVSSHRFPFYPGSGAVTETGEGAGAGFTVNMPLAAGMGDVELLHVWREVAGPVVAQFEPDLILVSAGFDTWRSDPLGGMNVSERGFRALMALFATWAEQHCPGRLAFTLEGGYDPEGVIAGVRASLDASASRTLGLADDLRDSQVDSRAVAVVERAQRELSSCWSFE